MTLDEIERYPGRASDLRAEAAAMEHEAEDKCRCSEIGTLRQRDDNDKWEFVVRLATLSVQGMRRLRDFLIELDLDNYKETE